MELNSKFRSYLLGSDKVRKGENFLRNTVTNVISTVLGVAEMNSDTMSVKTEIIPF